MRSEKDSGCIAWSGNRHEIQAVKIIYAVQLFLFCGLFTALKQLEVREVTEIYLAENHLLLETGYHDPQIHSHSAAHILLGLHGDMRVITEKETILCRGALLPSGTAHTVDSFGRPLLVFLLDVTSTVSEVRHIFSLAEQGLGSTQIAKALIREHIPTITQMRYPDRKMARENHTWLSHINI